MDIPNDLKRHYFNFKCVKDILDYLIVKKNLTFIGKFDMILDQIVFQYYSKYSLFNGCKSLITFILPYK